MCAMLQHGPQLEAMYGRLHACGVLQVTDGRRVLRVANGIEMLTKITAAGCSLNAVIAACLAVRPDDTLVATAQAMALYGCAPTSPVPMPVPVLALLASASTEAVR